MNNHLLKKFVNKKTAEIIVIILGSLALLYLLISLYFLNHYFLNTVINNVNMSLKSYNRGEELIKEYAKEYTLHLIERDEKTEYINSREIALNYNNKNSIEKVHTMQKSLKWLFFIFKEQNFYINDLYTYDTKSLTKRFDNLVCLNNEKVMPENVSFQYTDGVYKLIKEIDGNIINRNNLEKNIKKCIKSGIRTLDLSKNNCYEKPRYTMDSAKTPETKAILDKYVSTCITYKFGPVTEILDGNIINQWLIVDNNLAVEINVRAVRKYVKELSKKYDTVGIPRDFKTSIGKTIKVSGGLYGFKINQDAEVLDLLEEIAEGRVMEKEPVYTQKAFERGENEIGSTYVEINITRQYLWFYKKGKLIAQGAVVTGNPNRGNATVVGVNMLNYKQKGVELTGPGYEVGVTYWMPFYGNIGIHDAKWRNRFGGTIYKTNGTHGCVNAPLYLAKIIYENIESGIPIISYKEEIP